MLYVEPEGAAYSVRVNNTDICNSGNVADSSHEGEFAFKCSDGFARTAEVGRFSPNGIGVYDIVGNVSELVLACVEITINPNDWNSYDLTLDGSPEHPDSCDDGEVAAFGSTWNDGYLYYDPTEEAWDSRNLIELTPSRRKDAFDKWVYSRNSESWVGFRLVRELEE